MMTPMSELFGNFRTRDMMRKAGGKYTTVS